MQAQHLILLLLFLDSDALASHQRDDRRPSRFPYAQGVLSILKVVNFATPTLQSCR